MAFTVTGWLGALGGLIIGILVGVMIGTFMTDRYWRRKYGKRYKSAPPGCIVPYEIEARKNKG